MENCIGFIASYLKGHDTLMHVGVKCHVLNLANSGYAVQVDVSFINWSGYHLQAVGVQ